MQLSAAVISVIFALEYCTAATDARDVRTTVAIVQNEWDLAEDSLGV
jgi:hypothetical protein